MCSASSTLTPIEEINKLSTRFKAAWDFLKKTRLHIYSAPVQHIPLIKLPWYLVLGASGSGKTQFIKQSQLKLITDKHLAFNSFGEDTTQKKCNFWFSNIATLIDIPGYYFSEPVSSSRLSLLLPNFLAVVKKYIRLKPLDGLIVTINLANWAAKTFPQQEEENEQLLQTLYLITIRLKLACPVYFVFTHIDQIYGFKEFFSDLGKEERNTPWGITLEQNNPASLESQEIFTNYYNQLLYSLHRRLIWRMHHERLLENRIKIYNFPLQMEKLKDNLSHWLYRSIDIFLPHSKLSLNGIYFVSNLQDKHVVDLIHLPLNHLEFNIFDLNSQSFISSKSTKSYFSAHLLKKIINAPRLSRLQTFYLAVYPYLGVILGVFIFLSLITGGLFFYLKNNSLEQAYLTFSHYRKLSTHVPNSSFTLQQQITSQNLLLTTLKHLEQANLPWFMSQGIKHHSLKRSIESIYYHELKTRFVAILQLLIEDYIVKTKEPEGLYGALKTYLMLGTPAYFEVLSIEFWFQQYWKKELGGKDQQLFHKDLLTHLINLNKTRYYLPLKHEIINKARQHLNEITPNFLGYAVLKNLILESLSHRDTQSNKEKLIFPITPINPGLFEIYPTQFPGSYTQKLKDACEVVIKGNWVLGKRKQDLPLHTLINEVNTLYISRKGN